MKILIDYSQIPIQKTGVGVYAYNLISAIGKTCIGNKYYILVQDDDKSLDDLHNINLELIKIKSRWFRLFFLRCLLEQIYIPYLAVKYQIDVVHSLHYSFPVFVPSKKIVTIPDMTFYKYPGVHLSSKVYYFKFFIWLSSLIADALICISEATKKDYISYFKYRRDKIYTVYLGVSDSYKKAPAREKIKSVKNMYNIKGEYLLFIGTIEPRKNIKNLILAYKHLLHNGFNYKLVIVGKKGWYYQDIFNLIEKQNRDNKIILTGFIQEDEKKSLIDGAKLFIYPSIYEGFGIPVLEALACGIPTITSYVSSLPEVAGDAAILINPESVDELFDAIRLLLTDENIYNDLKTKSRIQAAKFDWRLTAIQTINIYESCI